MKFCTRCRNEVRDDESICPVCGYTEMTLTRPIKKPIKNEVSLGLCILSGMSLGFAFIYWCVRRKSAPDRAKACLLTGLITLAVVFGLLILAMCIVVNFPPTMENSPKMFRYMELWDYLEVLDLFRWIFGK